MDYIVCWTKRLGVSKYGTCHVSFGRSEGREDTVGQPFGHLAEFQTGYPLKKRRTPYRCDGCVHCRYNG
jgi:hypothetical protein